MNLKKIILSICVSCLLLSSCRDAELIEKADTFKPDRTSLTKIVILPPDFYFSKGSGDDETTYKDEDAIALEARVRKASIYALHRFRVQAEVPGRDDSIHASYFNNLARLYQQITSTGYVYDLENMDVKANYPNTEPLSANLILSPDLQVLQSQYGTPYFFHTMVLKGKKDMFILASLADVSSGKIIYRELMKVSLKPAQQNLNLLLFNIFNDMLNQI